MALGSFSQLFASLNFFFVLSISHSRNIKIVIPEIEIEINVLTMPFETSRALSGTKCGVIDEFLRTNVISDKEKYAE